MSNTHSDGSAQLRATVSASGNSATHCAPAALLRIPIHRGKAAANAARITRTEDGRVLKLRPAARAVYGLMSRWAFHTNHVRVAHLQLERETGFSRSSIKRALADLERLAFIARLYTPSARDRYAKRCSRYHVPSWVQVDVANGTALPTAPAPTSAAPAPKPEPTPAATVPAPAPTPPPAAAPAAPAQASPAPDVAAPALSAPLAVLRSWREATRVQNGLPHRRGDTERAPAPVRASVDPGSGKQDARGRPPAQTPPGQIAARSGAAQPPAGRAPQPTRTEGPKSTDRTSDPRREQHSAPGWRRRWTDDPAVAARAESDRQHAERVRREGIVARTAARRLELEKAAGASVPPQKSVGASRDQANSTMAPDDVGADVVEDR